jgi:sugar lactone lactonase YvrE
MAAVSQPECVWPLEAELGEGPVWAHGALWFVDIKQRRVHRYDPAGGGRQSWDAPDQTGFLAPVRGGGFVAGVRSGLHRFDPDTGAFTLITAVEPDRPQNRLNDGVVDAEGRLWFGSMDDSESGTTGALYRWDGKGPPVRMDDGYGITNGPAISPDGRTLYHTDTARKLTWAFDLGPDGVLSNKRLFRQYQANEGHPDGPAVDSAGDLWSSQFGGWGVRRYSPAGELEEVVRFPCPNVTKIAFAGDDRMTVYATTARLFMSEQQREEQPLAGALFRYRVDTPGQPSYELTL